MLLIIESNDLFSRLKMIDRLRRFPVTKLLSSLLLLVRFWFASEEKVPARAQAVLIKSDVEDRSSFQKHCNSSLIYLHPPTHIFIIKKKYNFFFNLSIPVSLWCNLLLNLIVKRNLVVQIYFIFRFAKQFLS